MANREGGSLRPPPHLSALSWPYPLGCPTGWDGAIQGIYAMREGRPQTSIATGRSRRGGRPPRPPSHRGRSLTLTCSDWLGDMVLGRASSTSRLITLEPQKTEEGYRNTHSRTLEAVRLEPALKFILAPPHPREPAASSVDSGVGVGGCKGVGARGGGWALGGG